MAESAVIGVLRAIMTLDSAEYESGIRRITKDTKVAETTFGDLGGVVASLGKVFAGVFTAQALIGFGKEVLAFADNVGDLADQTGISTSRLQAMNYVMAGSGVAIEELGMGISQLSRYLLENDKASATLRNLGLNLDNLIKLRPDEAFIALGEAIARLPTHFERSTAATEIFGRSGSKYLKVFSDQFGEAIANAERFGPIMDQDVIDRADRVDKAMARAWISTKAFAGSLAEVSVQASGTGWGALTDFLKFVWEPKTDPAEGIAAFQAALAQTSQAFPIAAANAAAYAKDVASVGMTSIEAQKAAAKLDEQLQQKTAKALAETAKQAEKAAEVIKDKLAKETAAYARLMSEIANEEGLARMQADAEAMRIASENGAIALEMYSRETVLLLRNQSDLADGLIYSTQAIEQQTASVGVGADAMMDAHAKSVEWRLAMDDLAQSFFQFASIAGDSLGKVVRQIGAGISAIGLAESAVGSLKQGFSAMGSGSILKGLTGIVGGIGGIASAASAAIQLVSSLISGLRNLFGGGWEGTVGNPKRDQFIAQYGGDQAMGQKILEALMTGGMDYTAAEARRQQLMDAGLYAADSESEMRAAMSAIADLIGGQVTLHSGGEVTARLKVGERVLSQDQNEWFNGVMDRMPTMDVLERVASNRGAQATAAAPSADRRLEDLVERRLPKLVGRAVADALTLSPRLRTS